MQGKAASLPAEFRERSYCPSCGGALTSSATADPRAICLSCPAAHRFFITPWPSDARITAKAAEAHFPELEHLRPEQVATFWLSDPSARSLLNGQLAELLRIILEGRAPGEVQDFSFCPICAGALTRYEQPDAWVRGWRCSLNHLWAERGGKLTATSSAVPFYLEAEISEPVVRKRVAGWLSGNPVLDSNLHESVRRVLAGSVFNGRTA